MSILAVDNHPNIFIETLVDKWALKKPDIVISVTGNLKPVNMRKDAFHAFQQGLVKVVSKTKCWILSGGKLNVWIDCKIRIPETGILRRKVLSTWNLFSELITNYLYLYFTKNHFTTNNRSGKKFIAKVFWKLLIFIKIAAAIILAAFISACYWMIIGLLKLFYRWEFCL